MTDGCDEVERLRAENAALSSRVVALESQLSFLSQHRTLAAGLAGEQLISGFIGGSRTVHTASVDIIMDDGRKIEVKFAKLSYPAPRSPSNPSRWQWGKIFGEKNKKDFDYIILVGDADPRFATEYKDPAAPFVIFFLNYEQAMEMVTAHTAGAKGILLGTNPLATAQKARRFFDVFQVTAEELGQLIGPLGPPEEP
jgi:hypothetical protein